ncbi:transmembrane protein 269 [Pseudopipra pipra]|uniref:transmembrane protein 269 n=1 Tax=Pseudopipra pipra TaxID=415032 RepID=UPI0031399E44
MGTLRHTDTTGTSTPRRPEATGTAPLVPEARQDTRMPRPCPQAPVWPPRVPPGRVPVPVSLPSLRNRRHRRVTENKEPFERCGSPPGIPFTYRGLPCPYPSALLASTFLLSGGHLALLRVAAGAMILGMTDCGSYPHDRVLESQRWKKLVYAGGVAAVLLAPAAVAAVYCLAWATSYIVFPSALWSCKA